MKIGLAQLNTTVGDFDGNRSLILDAYRKAVAQGAELVLTPELCITGYPPRDLVYRSQFVPRNKATLEAIANEVGDVPLITGFVDFNESGRGKPFRNAAAVLRHGKVIHVIHKTLLPTYDVFDEDRYFEPADLHKPVIIDGRRIGITISEDIWTDEFLSAPLYDLSPPRELAKHGIDLLVNISASPFHLRKPEIRERMMSATARELGVPVVYCNAVGGNDQLVFDGNSIAANAKGEIVHRGRQFEEELVVIDTGSSPQASNSKPQAAEQLHHALVLGLRDYVRKCGFKSCVLGLSGGIDSARSIDSGARRAVREP